MAQGDAAGGDRAPHESKTDQGQTATEGTEATGSHRGTEKRRLNGEDHSLKNILLRLFLRSSVSLWDPVPSVTSVPVRGTRGTHGSRRRSREEKTEKFFSVLFSVPPFLCVI